MVEKARISFFFFPNITFNFSIILARKQDTRTNADDKLDCFRERFD